ncbi:MAG TPA: RNA methyltransferase [Candidatus Coprenecus stercoravium]|uniref:RNA methyltransferase n=1 Tax=Candidatus Coprenecus stercoravium TaxID=2840735 RepID=A0A9D2K9R5_9BACT|nr:RNA methyltransferase [Candidatus Coprenecus stercoravium]
MFRKLLNSELGRPDIEKYKTLDKSPITVVLDNVRSRHNIGSAFRTCDAFRAAGIVLCGISSTPPAPEIHKSALGAEFSVDWVYRPDTVEAVKELKSKGYTIIGVEQTENSVSTDDFLYGRRRLEADGRYAVIFGNEVHGIAQEAVDLCDFTLEIPQYGTKHSLNVSVATGIVLYVLSRGLHV